MFKHFKLKLKNKPIGIDIKRHIDRDKRIKFKKIDAIRYLKQNKKKFDLILIKQTIHYLHFKKIKKLILLCNSKLNDGGKLFILTLETSRNEIPTFSLMKKKLSESLKRDKKIIKLITKLYPCKKSKFIYKVKILREKYLEMIKKRYISTLLPMTKSQIQKGMNEIKYKYKKNIKFRDKLICIIL